MQINPDYRGDPVEMYFSYRDEPLISTGRKVPANACDKCGRADWKPEYLTIAEAVERGILID